MDKKVSIIKLKLKIKRGIKNKEIKTELNVKNYKKLLPLSSRFCPLPIESPLKIDNSSVFEEMK